MSQYGLIYIIGRQGLSDPARIFARLIERLSERAVFHTTSKLGPDLPSEYSSWFLNSDDSLKNRSLGVSYTLLSGANVYFDLQFRHRPEHGRIIEIALGHPQQINSQALFPPQDMWVADSGLSDGEELLFRCFGLLDPRMYDPEIFHDGFIWNEGASYLEESSVIYHQDLKDFGADFLRIYGFHDQAMMIAPLLWSNIDLKTLPTQQYERYRVESSDPRRKRYGLHLRKMYRSSDYERFDFYARLSRIRAEQLASLPNQELLSLLQQTTEIFPDLKLFRHNQEGLMIKRDLEKQVWPIYDTILRTNGL
jgi:hypothetical protein